MRYVELKKNSFILYIFILF